MAYLLGWGGCRIDKTRGSAPAVGNPSNKRHRIQRTLDLGRKVGSSRGEKKVHKANQLESPWTLLLAQKRLLGRGDCTCICDGHFFLFCFGFFFLFFSDSKTIADNEEK